MSDTKLLTILLDPRTAKKVDELHGKLMQVVDPYIEEMNENDPDDVTLPKMLGFLIGVRYFIGQYEALETNIVAAMQKGNGMTPELYASIVSSCSELGIASTEAIKRAIAREEAAGR